MATRRAKGPARSIRTCACPVKAGDPTVAKTTHSQLDQQQRLSRLSDRVWKAHYLTPEEAAIGPLKQYEYAGTYQFTDSPSCSRNGSNTSKCLIRFPDENNAVSAKTACMVTKTGDKGHFVPNQDRSVMIDSSSTDGDWFLAALFDGHGSGR